MMNEAYKEFTSDGRFGKVKGVDAKSDAFPLPYYNEVTKYAISQGLTYPIIAAFRAIVSYDKNTGYAKFNLDPFNVWRKSRSKLVKNTIEMSRQLGNNPQSTGESVTLWAQNYDAVNSIQLQMQLTVLQNRVR